MIQVSWCLNIATAMATPLCQPLAHLQTFLHTDSSDHTVWNNANGSNVKTGEIPVAVEKLQMGGRNLGWFALAFTSCGQQKRWELDCPQTIALPTLCQCNCTHSQVWLPNWIHQMVSFSITCFIVRFPSFSDCSGWRSCQ